MIRRLYQVQWVSADGGGTDEFTSLFVGENFADAETQFLKKYHNCVILYISYGGIIE